MHSTAKKHRMSNIIIRGIQVFSFYQKDADQRDSRGSPKLKIGSFNLSRGQRFGGFIRLYLENNDKEFPRDTCSSGF